MSVSRLVVILLAPVMGLEVGLVMVDPMVDLAVVVGLVRLVHLCLLMVWGSVSY